MLPLYARSTAKLRKPDGFFPRSAFLSIRDLRGPRKVDQGQNFCNNLWNTHACTMATWVSDCSELESNTFSSCVDECEGVSSVQDLFHFQSESILQVAECYDKIEELLVQFDPCLIEDYVALVSNSRIFDARCINITVDGVVMESSLTSFTLVCEREPLKDVEVLDPRLFGNINEKDSHNFDGLEYICEEDLMLMPEPQFTIEKLCGDKHQLQSGILLHWKSHAITEVDLSLGHSDSIRIPTKPEDDIVEEFRHISSIWEEDSIPENRMEVFDLVSFETIDLSMLLRGRASSFGRISEPMRQLTLLPWPNSSICVSDERSKWKLGFLFLDAFQSRIEGRHLLRLDSPSQRIRVRSLHLNTFGCGDTEWPKTKLLIDIGRSILKETNHAHYQDTETISSMRSHVEHPSLILENFVRTALITPLTLYDDDLQREDVETIAVTDPPRRLQRTNEITDTMVSPVSAAPKKSIFNDNGYSSQIQQLLQKVGGEESASMTDICRAVDHSKLPDDTLKPPSTRTILMSEQFFEQQTECFHALREHFGINSVDYPFRDSADIVISEVCCIKTITPQVMGSIPEKREFIKGLCDLSFRYSFIWVILLIENFEREINSLLIPFAQSLACFPARVIVRMCTASTLPSHIVSIVDEDLRQSNQDQRSLSGYYMREFCKSLNTRPDLSAMCDFLQQFPTINIFTAALIITSFPSILAVVKANSETITHALRQWVPVPKVDRLSTNLTAFFALLHVRFT